MKTKIEKSITANRLSPDGTPKKINIQLDHCTFATISRMSSLEVWRKKYPDAKVMA